MASPRSTFFFATSGDLLGALGEVERCWACRYTLKGSFPSRRIESYEDADGIPGLGVSATSASATNPFYLLLGVDEVPSARCVPQRRGGERYIVDEVANPTAALITFGGTWDGDFLIAGEIIGTSNPQSLERYREVLKVFAGAFHSRPRCLVGKNAEGLWRAGWRLTQAARETEIGDLLPRYPVNPGGTAKVSVRQA